MSYNLLDEDWIPVLYRNGDWKRVGILKVFADAHRIREIAASNPMDRVAILRFLLALLYWCKGSPPTEQEEKPDASFPVEWFSKLEESEDCFNLLGEGKRFYQDPAAQRTRAITDLIQEIPTGNNFWHFLHSTDEQNGLCPACCAMGLLRLPLFSVSGLPDLKSGINGTPPIYVLRLGKSLKHTLQLNWTSYLDIGRPSWVQSDICLVPEQDVPLLTGFTLLSRRVALHEPSEPSGICMACGASEMKLIRLCEFESAGRQENEKWNDPHVLYMNKTPRKAVRAQDLTVSGRFKMDRPWKDLLTHIIVDKKHTATETSVSLLVVGFASDKAKNIDVWERTLLLPSSIDNEGESVSLIEQWHDECYKLAYKIRPPYEKASSRKHVEIPPVMSAIRPHIENHISARTKELLSGGEEVWNEAAREYNPMMRIIARSLSPGVSTKAIQRRRQIAGTVPDIKPKPEPVKKHNRKKGDNQ